MEKKARGMRLKMKKNTGETTGNMTHGGELMKKAARGVIHGAIMKMMMITTITHKDTMIEEKVGKRIGEDVMKTHMGKKNGVVKTGENMKKTQMGK